MPPPVKRQESPSSPGTGYVRMNNEDGQINVECHSIGRSGIALVRLLHHSQMGAEDEKQRPDGGADGAGTRSKPITESQFLSWKSNKDAAESARRAEAAQKRAADIVSGAVQMNGRELFLHEPLVFDNTRF